MPEHEMNAAEVHELVVEQQLGEKTHTVDPEKVNIDLGFSPVQKEKMDEVEPLQHNSVRSSLETPDDEEPNETEKRTLRRGLSQNLKENSYT